jgi:hypothetical protein
MYISFADKHEKELLDYYIDIMCDTYGLVKNHMDKQAWREYYDISLIACALKQIIAMDGIDAKQPRAIEMNNAHLSRCMAALNRRKDFVQKLWQNFMSGTTYHEMKYKFDVDCEVWNPETQHKMSRKSFWQHRSDLKRNVTKVAPAPGGDGDE